MGAEALLHAAVINNARWCDAVCRSHGYPGEFTGRLWVSARHALPFLLPAPGEPPAGDDLSWDAVTDPGDLAQRETAWGPPSTPPTG
jgi:hypothetical protein